MEFRCLWRKARHFGREIAPDQFKFWRGPVEVDKEEAEKTC